MNTTRILPTSQNKETFKAHLRAYKNVFSSPILSARFEEVSPIMVSYVSGITSAVNVDVALFDNAGTINVGFGTDEVTGNNLIYIPGLENDFVNLQVGSATTTLYFTSTGFSIGGNSVSIGSGFELGNKYFTVKGLGGGLLESGDVPTYTITPSALSVDEGSSISFTVNTSGVSTSQQLYYSTGGNVSAEDFTNNSLTGSFSLVSTGSTTGVGTITRAIATDFDNAESESFNIIIRTGSITGTAVTTSSDVTIGNVTSQFTVTSSVTEVNEGDSVTFTVSGNNIPPGTYYYTISEQSGDITSNDISSGLNGSFSILNNTGTFVVDIANDLTTENISDIIEKFKVEIRLGSISGTVVAESSLITINDTSQSVGYAANNKTFGPVQVNRDEGNVANSSDWYKICNIDDLPDGSSIALFIDGSGSMTESTVQASYDLLVSKLNARGITITTVTNTNEDWITPFLTDLP